MYIQLWKARCICARFFSMSEKMRMRGRPSVIHIARFYRTIATALHDALKLQSTRKTVWIPSRNYSKRRSLRSRPAHPPSSPPPTFPPPFLQSLTCLWNGLSERVCETLDARQWPNFTRASPLREKSHSSFFSPCKTFRDFRSVNMLIEPTKSPCLIDLINSTVEYVLIFRRCK